MLKKLIFFKLQNLCYKIQTVLKILVLKNILLPDILLFFFHLQKIINCGY